MRQRLEWSKLAIESLPDREGPLMKKGKDFDERDEVM